MSKLLKLTLNAADIKMAVKSETYITGQVTKATDMVKNAAKAFVEQAGNENYHEVKLYRTMKGAVAKFEAAIAEYVETSNGEASVSDTLTSSNANDSFEINITVNDRASSAFATPLAYLAQEYVINVMLYYWWQPIDATLAKDYYAFSEANILDIRRCLSKTAPTASSQSYATVSGQVVPVGDGGSQQEQIQTRTYNKQSKVFDGDTAYYYMIPLSDLMSGGVVHDNVRISIDGFLGDAYFGFINDIDDENDISLNIRVPYEMQSSMQQRIQSNSTYAYLVIVPAGDATSASTLTMTYTS